MNQFMTCSAILMGFSQFLLLGNFAYSIFFGPKCGRNPWEANTLEWYAPTPPPHGNFDIPPVVYRGPYEYSSPSHPESDYWPQTDPPGKEEQEDSDAPDITHGPSGPGGH
jgi:cytochrome c oxidase subunit 1